MAAFYTFAALMVCMFVGGWVSTRCTAGEFRSEAVLYGVIVWAITSSLLIPLTAIGVGTGVSTVLAAHGIAKVKTEVLPAVANAKDMAKQNVDSAKNQLASVEDRVKQAANGERSDEGRSNRDENSTAKGDVSNDSSADGKSTSNASGSQERQSNASRESDSSNDSRESSNDSDRVSRDESTDNNSRVPHQTREEFKAASWWAFGGSFASLIAVMLGAIVGPTISVVRHEIPVGRAPNVRAKVGATLIGIFVEIQSGGGLSRISPRWRSMATKIASCPRAVRVLSVFCRKWNPRRMDFSTGQLKAKRELVERKSACRNKLAPVQM